MMARNHDDSGDEVTPRVPGVCLIDGMEIRTAGR